MNANTKTEFIENAGLLLKSAMVTCLFVATLIMFLTRFGLTQFSLGH